MTAPKPRRLRTTRELAIDVLRSGELHDGAGFQSVMPVDQSASLLTTLYRASRTVNWSSAPMPTTAGKYKVTRVFDVSCSEPVTSSPKFGATSTPVIGSSRSA